RGLGERRRGEEAFPAGLEVAQALPADHPAAEVGCVSSSPQGGLASALRPKVLLWTAADVEGIHDDEGGAAHGLDLDRVLTRGQPVDREDRVRVVFTRGP